MRKICNIPIGILLCFVAADLGGQELVMPLAGNPDIQHQTNHTQLKKSLSSTPVELPVFEDFSQNSHIPAPGLWSDMDAYINQNYAVNPPSYGVATLDAVDSSGAIYASAKLDPQTFNADHLTSQPINLEYPASDSVYLSFYFQPMGNGIAPETYDSLCLDFFAPDSSWLTVWNTTGSAIQPFRQVMIPVTDTIFLKNGFRFRFRNRASLPKNFDYVDKRGNVDHWNIDYIILDRNRSRGDTVHRDVAISNTIPSMLQDYESIPWDHFEMAHSALYYPFINLTYFNNDTAVRNVTRTVEITDIIYGDVYSANSTTAQDISPDTSATAEVVTIYPFEFGRGDTAVFQVMGAVRTDEFDNKSNDTIYRNQVFRDFFAYDDGSAERAYGLRGQGTNNSYIAQKYESFIGDELGGVDIYFAQLKDSVNLNYFYKFIVWDDNDGEPGEIIYSDDSDYSVSYTNRVNRFKRIAFKEPVAVDGVFYVGILQYDQFLLNIGMDVSKSPSGKLFYSLGGSWQQSLAPGVVMLRPFVNRSYSVDTRQHTFDKQRMPVIYPNPARDVIHIDYTPNAALGQPDIEILDISGRTVKYVYRPGKTINISDLNTGIYLVRLIQAGFISEPAKLVINH